MTVPHTRHKNNPKIAFFPEFRPFLSNLSVFLTKKPYFFKLDGEVKNLFVVMGKFCVVFQNENVMR